MFPNEPALLIGATENWRAHRRWTWDHFAEMKGVILDLSDPHGFSGECVEIGQYARSVLASTSASRTELGYAAGWRFFESNPEMLDDFDEPEIAITDFLQRIPSHIFRPLLWIFLGPHNSGTTLHRDVLSTHAWLAVLAGRKRVALHPPASLDDNYEFHRKRALEVLHKREDLGPWRYFEVASTDLMCIPSDWWHEVVNDGPTIGLTRNFASPDIIEQVAQSATDRGLEKLLPWLNGVLDTLPR